jgi:hypothetical protein
MRVHKTTKQTGWFWNAWLEQRIIAVQYPQWKAVIVVFARVIERKVYVGERARANVLACIKHFVYATISRILQHLVSKTAKDDDIWRMRNDFNLVINIKFLEKCIEKAVGCFVAEGIKPRPKIHELNTYHLYYLAYIINDKGRRKS